MFDVAWQELLVVGIVALIVVGPKELPTLLRTVGKYVGIVKRQASEFRAQFDEAMRESELAQLRKDVENIKSEAESSFRDVEQSVNSHVSGMKQEFDTAAQGISASDAADKPASLGSEAATVAEPSTGAGSAAVAAAAAAASPTSPSSPPPKSGS